ncbi:hypothetical protein [Thermopolyspora flexuosa]|jgi:hypothetical protein|uniref:Small secreted domain DUF320 n=1 Tax=Thermopolyspora flexuosa TaxID=103836 RepID=A0A543IUD7_9ACTN|nr:hypothetical protein [Thermopolyspora flexuosa]TQM74193.1 hypothetical protein FHX40_0858 [Thermopolyspora flexuosa]
MRIRTRAISVALLTGLAGATLLGGASAAQAHTGFGCANGINAVNCNTIPAKVGVAGNRILSGSLDVIDVKGGKLIDIDRTLNPPISVKPKDVNVCVGAFCP